MSAVHTAVGRLPIVAGKPERAIFDAAVERFAASSALFLGDRLDTDILGANRAGIASALVLTGIDGPKQVLAADADSRPTFLLGDLRELFEPYPAPVEETDAAHRRPAVPLGAAPSCASPATSSRIDAAGDRAIDLLRAGTAAVWGAGVPIYALDVDAGAIFVAHERQSETPDVAPTSRDDEPSALVTRLRVIEDQPLETRAEALAQVHDELRAMLEAGDARPHA